MDEQNHYEILEVSPTATWPEIQTSYALAKKTYTQDALGGYSLFGDQEQQAILDKIEAAYQVLSDPQKRAQYDQTLRVSVPDEEAMTFPPEPEVLPPMEIPLDVVTGGVIKMLREQKGLTLEEIADATRININYLSFIEADRFDALPAEVYVSSYIRQMIKMIQCHDDKIVVDRYMKEYRARRVPSRM